MVSLLTGRLSLLLEIRGGEASDTGGVASDQAGDHTSTNESTEPSVGHEPEETNVTAPTGTTTDGGAAATEAVAKSPPEVYLGLHNKQDGRRTYCLSGSSEESRLRRNGFVVVTFRETLRAILEWMVTPTQLSISTQDARQQSDNQPVIEDNKVPAEDATGGTKTTQRSSYRPASGQRRSHI